MSSSTSSSSNRSHHVQLQQQQMKLMNASSLQQRPYYLNPNVPLTPTLRKQHKESHESSDFQELNRQSTYIYYISDYIQASQIPSLITQIPYIATAGDSHIILQRDPNRAYRSLENAKHAEPHLISNTQRRLSRNKVIVTDNMVYAYRGYRRDLQPVSQPFQCFVLTAAGPQFEAHYLDYSDFIVTCTQQTPIQSQIQRLPQYAHWGEIPSSFDDAKKLTNDFIPLRDTRYLLHKTGYVRSMIECLHMYLFAFSDSVKRKRQLHNTDKLGYLKVIAIGCGFFADVYGTEPHENIGRILMPLIMEAIYHVLNRYTYEYIGVIEFPDFSSEKLFTPAYEAIKHIQLVKAPYKDVLDFSDSVLEKYWVGALNPGDCFALPGNELSYSSVEAAIGNNTTIRLTQSYLHNALLLDTDRYIAVDQAERAKTK